MIYQINRIADIYFIIAIGVTRSHWIGRGPLLEDMVNQKYRITDIHFPVSISIT